MLQSSPELGCQEQHAGHQATRAGLSRNWQVGNPWLTSAAGRRLILSPGRIRSRRINDYFNFSAAICRFGFSQAEGFYPCVVQFEVLAQVVANHHGPRLGQHAVSVRIALHPCISHDYG